LVEAMPELLVRAWALFHMYTLGQKS
jgi:hypothetical protein